MPFVYILASRSATLYVGVCRDLVRRVWTHRQLKPGSFTARYRVTRLVSFEQSERMISAIEREKQLKKWGRARKIALIEQVNPEWRDLAAGWFDRDGRGAGCPSGRSPRASGGSRAGC
jgi:putative endonuclease